MEQKVSTKGYEDYKKVLNEIDTLDSREKDYIVEQSKEMIIEAGIAEKAMEVIGLKRDTAEIPTYGEYYNERSFIWRMRNFSNKQQMDVNTIIDTARLRIKNFEVKATMGYIEMELHYVNKYSYDERYWWSAEIPITVIGKAIVHHNLNNLERFTIDSYDYYKSTYKQVKDSIYSFKVEENESAYYISNESANVSYSDWRSYGRNKYFPNDIVVRNELHMLKEMEDKYYNMEGKTLKFKEVALKSIFISGTKRIYWDDKFLTEKEYNELSTILSSNDTNLVQLKVKYGLN